LLSESGSVRNIPIEAPEYRIELADDPILLEFQEARQRYLRIDVFLNGRGVVAACREAKSSSSTSLGIS
jgi:hypothetical protein